MDTSFFVTNIELVYLCAKENVDIGIHVWYKLIKKWY